jgi:hypothetical protein
LVVVQVERVRFVCMRSPPMHPIVFLLEVDSKPD